MRIKYLCDNVLRSTLKVGGTGKWRESGCPFLLHFSPSPILSPDISRIASQAARHCAPAADPTSWPPHRTGGAEALQAHFEGSETATDDAENP